MKIATDKEIANMIALFEDYYPSPKTMSVFTNIGVSNMEKQEQGVPEFLNLLEQSKAIHLKKKHDYAQEDNPFSNFERSAIIMSWFNDPVDKAFANLVGTKLARLAELRNGKVAKNESIADTVLDLFTYCGLWGAYIIRSYYTVRRDDNL